MPNPRRNPQGPTGGDVKYVVPEEDTPQYFVTERGEAFVNGAFASASAHFLASDRLRNRTLQTAGPSSFGALVLEYEGGGSPIFRQRARDIEAVRIPAD